MTRGRLLAAGCLVAGLGTGYAVVTHDDGSRAPSPVDLSAVVPGRTVHVATGVPSVRFIPLGAAPRDVGTWSAQHAYNALVQDPSKLSPIPATVRPYYGLLHDRSASSRAVNVRVWAFAVEAHCTDRDDPPVSASTTASSRVRCRLWEFVDARTGESVGEVSQEVLPD